MIDPLRLEARMGALAVAERRRDRIGGFGSFDLFCARLRSFRLYCANYAKGSP